MTTSDDLDTGAIAVVSWLARRLDAFPPPDRTAVLAAVVGQATTIDQGWSRWPGRDRTQPRGRVGSRGVLVLLAALLGSAVATIALIGAQPSPSPREPGVFVPAGREIQPRSDQSATLLPDGRVLLVGGWVDGEAGPPVASAELWDPATRTFRQAGSLERPRDVPQAVLVDGGRVLIVGGIQFPLKGTTPPAELWDPATLSFVPAGALFDVRTGPPLRDAEILGRQSDGRVAVVARQGSGVGAVTLTIELWDPGTRTFAVTGTFPALGGFDTATPLPDDRVLLIGGDPNGTMTGAAQLLDVATGQLTPAGTLAQPRSDYTATLLSDGRVLVIGGIAGEDRWLASAELWDPTTLTFRSAGSLPETSEGHTATALPDGRVLVLGGATPTADNGMVDRKNAYLWDPVSSAFNSAGSMQEAHPAHFSSTLLPDGRVLILGGPDAELWTP